MVGSSTGRRRRRRKERREEAWKEVEDFEGGEKPERAPDIQGQLRAKGKEHRFWRTRTCELKNGVLAVYRNRRTKKKRVQEGKMDLGITSVSFQEKEGRIRLQSQASTYQLKLKKTEFPKWIAGIRNHRQRRQAEMREREERGVAGRVKHAESHVPELKQLLQEFQGSFDKPDNTELSKEKQRQKLDSFMHAARALVDSLQKDFKLLNSREKDWQVHLEQERKPTSSLADLKSLVDGSDGSQVSFPPLDSTPTTTVNLPHPPQRPQTPPQATVKTIGKTPVRKSKSTTFIPTTREKTQTQKTEAIPIAKTREKKEARPPPITPVDSSETISDTPSEDSSEERPPTRRKILPAPTPKPEKISLLKLATNKFQAPIGAYEPLSMLQFVCEELEYSHLLDRAANTPYEVERICWVASFAISSYAKTSYRGGRKPFNPLLGETFDCDRLKEEEGWRVHSEQVSHHPPISAVSAESRRGWKLEESVGGNVKLSFNKCQLTPTTAIKLSIPKYKEVYTWNKVSTLVHNIQSPGKMFVSHFGTMKVEGSNGIECQIQFPKGENDRKLKGSVSRGGQSVLELAGNWTQGLWTETARYFQAKPPLPDHPLYYGFGQFARELNEVTRDILPRLPPTDSRLRPDQRCLEEGNLKAAETKKASLEQSQRDRAARRQHPFHPLWFTLIPNTTHQWTSKGNYWKAKDALFNGITFLTLW